ncbi:MAG: cytochrome c biogenesis CcdA family protein [Spirochaetaceae bacterium]|jgi:cytochrome c-type biogenesis protein|nr:cytochrome c biogenesis CcdA family protein [Spirochaetaceae bacterium]GMO15576.1 MAG: cytochrome c biogenesis protein CcdA [Termitinemataceae bacterium]
MDNNISIITAFVAGVLSFASPCVLPVLSGYFMFIAGNNAGAKHSNRLLAWQTLIFVLGFSIVFVLLSVLVYGIFSFAGAWRRVINIAAGAVVIVIGLNIIFNFIPFLKFNSSEGVCETCVSKGSVLAIKRDSILHPARRPHGVLGALLVGMAFGLSWTPCVGAFLGSILLLAGQSGSAALSGIYLAVYSAGLGLPFVLAGIFWGKITGFLGRFRRIMPVLRIVSGVFLTGTGVIMILGKFFLINAWLQAL